MWTMGAVGLSVLMYFCLLSLTSHLSAVMVTYFVLEIVDYCLFSLYFQSAKSLMGLGSALTMENRRQDEAPCLTGMKRLLQMLLQEV